MNKNPSTRFLLGLLTASALFSLVCYFVSLSDGSQLRQLQPKVQAVNTHSLMVKSLLNDLFEYSRKDPAILPVIETTGLIKSNGPAPTATAKPTTK